MYAVVKFLSERRLLNVALLLLYMAVVIFLHDPMVELSVWIMNKMSLDSYDKLIALVAVLLAGFFGLAFACQLNKNRENAPLPAAMLAGTLLMLLLHLKVLLVLNIELIHMPQYALLALLLFPLAKKYGHTMLLATLFAYVDEWYQYQLLYPERENYFDFNDVITDQLGMGLMLLWLFAFGAHRAFAAKSVVWYRSKMLWFAAGLLLAVGLAFAGGWVVCYAGQAQPHTWLVLNEGLSAGPFWQEFYTSGRFYHVLTPLQGVLAHLFLIGYYAMLDWRISEGESGFQS